MLAQRYKKKYESGDKHHNLGMGKVTHYTSCDFPGYSKCGNNILWLFSCDLFLVTFFPVTFFLVTFFPVTLFPTCLVTFYPVTFFSVYHLCIVYILSHLLEEMYENQISILLKFHVLPLKNYYLHQWFVVVKSVNGQKVTGQQVTKLLGKKSQDKNHNLYFCLTCM